MSFPFMAALGDKAVFTEYISTNTFDVGQLGMTEDGSMWRLSKAGAALTLAQRGVINANTHLSGVTGDSVEAALSAAVAIGDTDYTLDDTNTRAADYYKGGYSADPRSAGQGPMRIIKSDAGVGTSVKCYVAGAFAVANDSGNTVHAYPSPWGNIKAANGYSQGYEQFAGAIPFGAITSGYFFWLKVKGPNWFGVYSTWPAAAQHDRMTVFYMDGSIRMADESYNGAVSEQLAGYLIQSGNYGDVLIALNLF